MGRLGLATINLQAKFEVSNYTVYKDMKSGAKCDVTIALAVPEVFHGV